MGKSKIDGQGLFVQGVIKSGARVLQYIGEPISKAESLRRCEAGNQFIFCLNETEDLDGSGTDNLARYINHSCSPNAEARFEQGEVWIVALRDIAVGEEITFNYSYDLEDYKNHPCYCGASTCTGFMVAEEFFEHVKRRHA